MDRQRLGEGLRRRITYANVTATLALVVATSGTSYAVARNSVGTPQLKNNAVTSAKVDDRTLRIADLARTTVSDLQLPGVVPPGASMRGNWGLDAEANTNSATGDYRSYVSYHVPFAAALTPHLVTTVAVPGCPGTVASPRADAGNLCVYVGESFGGELTLVELPEINTRFGFAMQMLDNLSNTSDIWGYGTWAATAPPS